MSEQVVLDAEIDIFLSALRSLGAGGFLKEATENLKTAVREAVATKKQATITMRVMVKPDGELEGEILLVGSNSVALPKTPTKARYFINSAMLPTREKPEQLVFQM